MKKLIVLERFSINSVSYNQKQPISYQKDYSANLKPMLNPNQSDSLIILNTELKTTLCHAMSNWYVISQE